MQAKLFTASCIKQVAKKQWCVVTVLSSQQLCDLWRLDSQSWDILRLNFYSLGLKFRSFGLDHKAGILCLLQCRWEQSHHNWLTTHFALRTLYPTSSPRAVMLSCGKVCSKKWPREVSGERLGQRRRSGWNSGETHGECRRRNMGKGVPSPAD